MNSKNLKQIVVTKENYSKLKKFGFAGDSFNDVITELLKKLEEKWKRIIVPVIPLKHIASYLGIALETLSRVRGKR